MNIALLLTAAMLPISLFVFVRNPLNGASIVAVLSWIFGVLPGLYYLISGEIPSYSWRNMAYVGGPIYNKALVEPGLIELIITVSMFTIGCLFSDIVIKFENEYSEGETFYSKEKITILIVGIWVASAIYFFSLSNWRIDLFLFPVKTEVEASGYLETIYLSVPIVMFSKYYWESGKFNRWSAFWLFVAVCTAFSRSQRRDLVTIAMFTIAFVPLMRALFDDRIMQTARDFGREIGARLVTVTALLGALALVPILWYTRVQFTAAEQGVVVDATSIRSFSDLVLGSPATGYPTYLLVRQHVASNGADPFQTISYLASIPIPRSLWGGKPTDIDNILESRYFLTENPSIFWFGEIYYSFGIFAIPVALLFGFLLFSLIKYLSNSQSLIFRTYAAVMFMHSLTLYKNGISHFVINAGVIIILFGIIWYGRVRPLPSI